VTRSARRQFCDKLGTPSAGAAAKRARGRIGDAEISEAERLCVRSEIVQLLDSLEKKRLGAARARTPRRPELHALAEGGCYSATGKKRGQLGTPRSRSYFAEADCCSRDRVSQSFGRTELIATAPF